MTKASSTGSTPMQSKIEATMKRFHEEERWESIFLFSPEGLLMASQRTATAYDEENLLEFAFSLIDAVRLLGDDLLVKEITARGRNGKILVFRYFHAWEDEFILAAVVSGKKGYRRALTRLVKLIQSLG